MNQFRFRTFFVTISCILSTPLLSAIITLDELGIMSQKSSVIVHAGVAAVEPSYDPSGQIITLITLEVLENLKGAAGDKHLTVYQVGGELDGKAFRLPGAHRYELGEEIILFAVKLPGEDKIVSYGLGVGKFIIKRDSNGRKVVEDLRDVLVATQKQGAWNLSRPSPRSFASVEQFKEKILASLAPQAVYDPLLIKALPQEKTWHIR